MNANEKNQFMVLQSIIQLLEGKRHEGKRGPQIATVVEQWKKSQNLTSDEQRNLKSAETYLRKFLTSVYNRLSPKEKSILEKKILKFDFKLVDDYTLKQVNRNIQDRFVNAVVPREQFYKWTEEIMCVKCNGCTKDGNTCELNAVFEDNFIPESGFDLPNCKFAYKVD